MAKKHQKTIDDMAKKFSHIEQLLSGAGKNCSFLEQVAEARKIAHEAWKELVNAHGANPAP